RRARHHRRTALVDSGACEAPLAASPDHAKPAASSRDPALPARRASPDRAPQQHRRMVGFTVES
ncbi:MAG: hypothetical protein ABI140_14570, partial [Jatrophihabitantaceae bacterium]